MRRSICLGLFVLSLVVFLPGCSGGGGVEGSVTLDGQPVDGATIAFISSDGKGGNLGGEIKDGKYSISAENLTAGSYRVEIYWHKSTGKQVNNPNDPGTKVEVTQQVIPDEYNRNTRLTADLKAGSNKFDFALKSGGVITDPKKGGSSGGPGDETQPGKKRN